MCEVCLILSQFHSSSTMFLSHRSFSSLNGAKSLHSFKLTSTFNSVPQSPLHRHFHHKLFPASFIRENSLFSSGKFKFICLQSGRRRQYLWGAGPSKRNDAAQDLDIVDKMNTVVDHDTERSTVNAKNPKKYARSGKNKRLMRQMRGRADSRLSVNDRDLFRGAEQHPKSFTTKGVRYFAPLSLLRYGSNGMPISKTPVPPSSVGESAAGLTSTGESLTSVLSQYPYTQPSNMKWPSIITAAPDHTLDHYSRHLFDPSLSWPCYIIQKDNLNTVKYSSIDRKYLKNILGLRTRDVQILVSLNNYPIILPRDSCIIVDVKNVQCIIQPQKVLILEKAQPSLQFMVDFVNPEQNTRELSEFIAMELKHLDSEQPFELNVLESILRFVILRAEHSYLHFHNSLEHILNDPDKIPSEERMHNMLVTKQSMSRFLTYLTDCHQCIDSLLSSDEDMTRLYITERIEENKIRPIQEHEEVELLLEAYYAQIEDVTNRVKELIRDIQSTQDYLNICLDSQRNKMIEFELRLVIGSFVVSMATLIAGVFGMNLFSGMETDPNMFWYVTGGTFVGGFCALVAFFGIAKRKGLFESVVSFLKIRHRKKQAGTLQHHHSTEHGPINPSLFQGNQQKVK